MKCFYVIEVNEGKGPTGNYLKSKLSKDDETGMFIKDDKGTKEITDEIYEAVKFSDKESAEFVYSVMRLTMKDWLITEHAFM